MLNSDELKKLRNIEISSCDVNELADLRNITVDTAKPIRERLDSFKEQTGNPYLFKVGDTVIKADYRGKRDISLILADFMAE